MCIGKGEGGLIEGASMKKECLTKFFWDVKGVWRPGRSTLFKVFHRNRLCQRIMQARLFIYEDPEWWLHLQAIGTML
jgi:hypothetical protein